MRRVNVAYICSRSGVSGHKVFLSIILAILLTGCSEKSAEDYLSDALQFTENGNNYAAVVALKNAVQAAPLSAKIRFELGKVYIQLESFEEASKELTRALEYGFDESKITTPLALALSRSGANVALADLIYDPTLLSPEERLEVGARRVTSLLSLNRTGEASTLIDQLALVEANTPYKGMLLSYQFAIAQNIPQAIDTIDSVLNTSPANRDVINLAARLYVLNGDIDNAIILYEKYVGVAPNDIQTKFALIDMLMAQKQFQKAETHIDELLAINGTSGILNLLKATVRTESEDYAAAKNFAETAINSGFSNQQVRLIAGLASYKLNNFDSAVRHLSVVAGTLPDDHQALIALADSQLQLNMAQDASELLSRLDSNEFDPLLLFPRASYEMIKSGDINSAKEMIKQRQQTDKTADDLLRTGALKLAVNDVSGVTDIERAHQLSPQSYEIKSSLAGAYSATRQLDKGTLFAKQWQQEQPTQIEGYMLEADMLSMQQKYVEAQVLVNKAFDIDATNSYVQIASILLDMKLDKYNQALPKVKALLAKEPANVEALASYYKITTELGDAREAIAQIKSVFAGEQDNQALTLLLASILVTQAQFNEALTILNRIKPDRFTLDTYWRVKGIALFSLNNTKQLTEHYLNWRRLFPDNIDATLGFLKILDLQGDYAEAAAVAEAFLQNNNAVQIAMLAAHYAAMAGDSSAAKKRLNVLPTGIQNLPFSRGVSARVALLEGRGKEGVDDAEVAYLEAKTSTNLLLYVQTLDSANRSDYAFTIIQQHVTEFPADINSKALLALRQAAINPEAALALYEALLIQIPDSPDLLNNAAYLHFQAQNFEKAYEYSSKAHQNAPNNLDFADTYAQVLMQRGEVAQAVETYNLVINDALSNEQIILNYIEALLVSNNNRAAKNRIEQFKFRLKSQASKDQLLQLQIKYVN